MIKEPKLLVPVQRSGLRARLEKAEALLANSQNRAAEQLLIRVFEILELDDPMQPSLVKVYTLSRLALAKAYQIQSENKKSEEQTEKDRAKLLSEIKNYLNYYQQWDTPASSNSGGIFLWVCRFTKSQLLSAFKQSSEAKQELEQLYTEVNSYRQKSKLYLKQKLDLLLAIAKQLEDLGHPIAPQELAEIAKNKPKSRLSEVPLVNYKVYLRYQEDLMICPADYQGNIYSAADGSSAWFDPYDEQDVKLLLQKPAALMETDDSRVLKDIKNPKYEPYNEFLIYQPWREPLEDSELRLLGALTPDMSEPIGQCLNTSPVRHLFLVTGGVTTGTLAGLKNGLGGHKLETLGLIWFFTGDDITDVPTMAQEIGDLCEACGNKKLVLLTPGWFSYMEENLVKAFSKVTTLKECKIFWSKLNELHKPIKTKALDALMGKRQC